MSGEDLNHSRIKRELKFVLLLTVFLLILPQFQPDRWGLEQQDKDQSAIADNPFLEVNDSAVIVIPTRPAVSESQDTDEPKISKDQEWIVRVLMLDGSVQELTMEEYLWGVIAAEMPVSFHDEALKAQACAARTYAVYKQRHGPNEKHPNADVCTNSGCCQAFVEREKMKCDWGNRAGEYEMVIAKAVSDTDGMVILYDGEPIGALYFSAAASWTMNAEDVWGTSVDYLKSVESPEGSEVPEYFRETFFKAEEVEQIVAERYPEADLSSAPSEWAQDILYTKAGTISGLSLGKVRLSAGQLQRLFSLRSPFLTITWTGEQFCFHITGYGHGVGMSQYGANAMAENGKLFQDILAWYYTDTEIGYVL